MLFIAFTLASCSYTPRPKKVENICSIYRQYPNWYWESLKAQQKWGLPPPVLMSIIYQESGFKADAKPERTKLLWIIPWTRPSSAYGYSQALDGTWALYKKQTGHRGNRHNFGSAADFIGWYVNLMNKKLGLPKNNAYDVYLAYHEGTGNYAKKSYLKKPCLIDVAKKVQNRSLLYKKQLASCEKSLPKEPWWRLW